MFFHLQSGTENILKIIYFYDHHNQRLGKNELEQLEQFLHKTTSLCILYKVKILTFYFKCSHISPNPFSNPSSITHHNPKCPKKYFLLHFRLKTWPNLHHLLLLKGRRRRDPHHLILRRLLQSLSNVSER